MTGNIDKRTKIIKILSQLYTIPDFSYNSISSENLNFQESSSVNASLLLESIENDLSFCSKSNELSKKETKNGSIIRFENLKAFSDNNLNLYNFGNSDTSIDEFYDNFYN